MQRSAYVLATSDGGVYTFGGATNYGSLPAEHVVPYKPVVGVAAWPTGGGYWMDASDGGVFSFGKSTRFFGSMGGHPLDQPIVGMASTVTGHGYWLVAADGGIFSFGTARFFGSVPGIVPHITLRKPIVGMAAMPTGDGYWLVASDGGIFTFGDTNKFYGSTGNIDLKQPIVGMAAMPTGDGYWLVARDGGIFTFGRTNDFYGSLGAQTLASPIVGMAGLPTAGGYWVTSSTGQVTNFGQAVPWGMTPSGIPSPVVGIAEAVGNGDPNGTVYQAGSTGYDVSDFQCGQTLPQTHAIGIVEVEGWSFGGVNPCLAQQVSWAAGGLSLYTFLSYPIPTTPQVPTPSSLPVEPGCADNPTAPVVANCDFGYAAAMSSYDGARGVIGTRVRVPWWIDIETIGGWTKTTAANRSVVVGAFDALHFTEGMNTVGFYFNLSGWNSIVGAYDPPGLLFPAWWTGPTPATKCATARTVAARTFADTFPSGPIVLLQYQDGGHTPKIPFDEDYAC